MDAVSWPVPVHHGEQMGTWTLSKRGLICRVVMVGRPCTRTLDMQYSIMAHVLLTTFKDDDSIGVVQPLQQLY
jgi:hypothetical protein